MTLSSLSCGWPVALSIMSSEDPSTFHKNAELPWAGRGQGQGGGGTPSSSPPPSPVSGDLASPPQLAGCHCRIHVAFRGAGFALTLEGQQGAQGGGQGVSQAEEGAGVTLHRCRCGRPPTARAGRGQESPGSMAGGGHGHPAGRARRELGPFAEPEDGSCGSGRRRGSQGAVSTTDRARYLFLVWGRPRGPAEPPASLPLEERTRPCLSRAHYVLSCPVRGEGARGAQVLSRRGLSEGPWQGCESDGRAEEHSQPALSHVAARGQRSIRACVGTGGP